MRKILVLVMVSFSPVVFSDDDVDFGSDVPQKSPVEMFDQKALAEMYDRLERRMPSIQKDLESDDPMRWYDGCRKTTGILLAMVSDAPSPDRQNRLIQKCTSLLSEFVNREFSEVEFQVPAKKLRAMRRWNCCNMAYKRLLPGQRTDDSYIVTVVVTKADALSLSVSPLRYSLMGGAKDDKGLRRVLHDLFGRAKNNKKLRYLLMNAFHSSLIKQDNVLKKYVEDWSGVENAQSK